jgi:hypothetical protein
VPGSVKLSPVWIGASRLGSARTSTPSSVTRPIIGSSCTTTSGSLGVGVPVGSSDGESLGAGWLVGAGSGEAEGVGLAAWVQAARMMVSARTTAPGARLRM